MMIDMAFRRDFTSPSLYELLDQRSARQRNDRRRRLALQAHQDAGRASNRRRARAWPLRRRVLPTTRTELHSGFQERDWVESRRTLHRTHGLSPRESWHMQGQERSAFEDGSTIAHWLADERNYARSHRLAAVVPFVPSPHAHRLSRRADQHQYSRTLWEGSLGNSAYVFDVLADPYQGVRRFSIDARLVGVAP